MTLSGSTATGAALQPFPIALLEEGTADPEIHRTLLKAALREIAAMQDHFMMLGRKSAVEKVTSFLAVLARRAGETNGTVTQFRLPMGRADIADFLGLTIETVSRAFTQLRKEGVIALNGVHTVRVLRPDALAAIAEGQLD